MRDQAAALDALGNVHTRRNEYTKALDYYNQSLALVRKIGQKNRQGWLYHNIAKLHFEQGDFPAARSYYLQALEVGKEMEIFELIYLSMAGFATIEEKQHRYDEALSYYDQAMTLIESVRERLRIESYKTTFMEDKIPIYEAAIALLIRQGKYEKAYAYLQRFRARSFLEIVSPERIDITKGISPLRFEHYQHWEQKLRETYQRLGNEYRKGEEQRNEKLILALEDSLHWIRQEHQRISDELRLHHPRYAHLTGIAPPLTLQEIQQKVVQPGINLVEYFVSPKLVAAWVIQPDGFHCEILDSNGEELENMIERLREPFKAVKEQKITNLAQVPFSLQLSQKLYELIFQPLVKYLAKDTQIIVVPDGILYYLPFEALVTDIAKKRHDPKQLFSRYQNAHYLIEDYAISYVPAASILALERTAVESQKPSKGKLVAFGKPDFGPFKDVAAAEMSLAANLSLKKSQGLIFAPLSVQDVYEVSEIMRPASVFIEDEATEDRFKKEAGYFSNIYLSTHAIIYESQPMYSLIAFAQNADPSEDGFLHTYEVFNLRLNADLVTLSACETGLGKLSRGEGLIGLTRAFLYAGAQSVVVSMWSVDESTAMLMKHFYKNIRKGKTKIEALQQAKLTLLKTREKGLSFAHPFLWAPFVLVGEPF